MATYESRGLKVPDHWNLFLTASQLQDVDRMRDFLIRIGVTGKLLAVHSSEEDRKCFFNQISTEISLPVSDQLEILFNYWVDEAVKCMPMKRRLEGDRASLWLCNMRDAVSGRTEIASASESSVTPIWTFIPQPSKHRRSRLDTPGEVTANEREMMEKRDLDKWAIRLYQIYDQREAPLQNK